MDQPAHAEKPCLNARPGHFEVIETFRAFPRSGTVIRIDSLSRPLLHVSWAASTVFRYVTPRGPTHDDAPILKPPSQHQWLDILPATKPLNRCRTTELKFQTRLYQSR
jgi:hypothetical protein